MTLNLTHFSGGISFEACFKDTVDWGGNLSLCLFEKILTENQYFVIIFLLLEYNILERKHMAP